MYGKTGMGWHPLRVAMALRSLVRGFHIVGDGIDPWGHKFLPRFVGVINVWKDF